MVIYADHYYLFYQYLRKKQFIANNCKCPKSKISEESVSSVQEEVDITTNRGKFYYDYSAPKQKIYPPADKDSSPYNEYIQWSGGRELGDESSDKLPWIQDSEDNNKNMANPNWRTDEEEEKKTWTMDL